MAKSGDCRHFFDRPFPEVRVLKIEKYGIISGPKGGAEMAPTKPKGKDRKKKKKHKSN